MSNSPLVSRFMVTGSRGWRDKDTVKDALLKAHNDFPCEKPIVVHGACENSPDMIADAFALEQGWDVERYPADWHRNGAAAGFMRNQDMVELGATVCLGFALPCRKLNCHRPQPHDTHGAADCMRRAELWGITVRRYIGG